MKILISGASGLVGTALQAEFKRRSWECWTLVRDKKQQTNQTIYWDIKKQEIDINALNGFDVVLHLAGQNVASGLWTYKLKRELRDSRVLSTRLLTDALAKVSQPPKLYLQASAIGFYGDTGARVVDESTPAPKEGFLPILSCEWEGAVSKELQRKVRTCFMRFGIILSSQGGALKKMLPAFKLGVAGKIGSGKQYMSWITLADVVVAICFCIEQESISGSINFVAPEPVTNSEFTKALGHVLHRPTLFPLPAIIVKVLFGEMGETLLLGSTRVEPKKLNEAGFVFAHTNIREALQAALTFDKP